MSPVRTKSKTYLMVAGGLEPRPRPPRYNPVPESTRASLENSQYLCMMARVSRGRNFYLDIYVRIKLYT